MQNPYENFEELKNRVTELEAQVAELMRSHTTMTNAIVSNTDSIGTVSNILADLMERKSF
jgi:cell division septum initiation protein DivIVA